MDAFSSALRDALLDPNPATSTDAVQQVVINQLRELDPQAKIRTTGYFNHSWVPDFRLMWGDEQRDLFLRFNPFDSSFADDLRFVGAADRGNPVFLDIAQPDMALDAAAPRQGTTVPGDTGVMLTEHEAWGQLGASVNADADVRVATRQIVRGGRGVVDEDAARKVVEHYRSASSMLAPEAVGLVDPKELREVLDRLEEPLARTARLDLEGELRGRWVKGGRDPEMFPSLEGWELHDRSREEIAAFVMALVSGEEAVPDDRWAEIADAITADALGAAARGMRRVTGGKVNDLVRVARNTWTARWAWVPEVGREGAAGNLDWSLGGTSLELNLGDHRAVFADLGNRFNTMAKPDETPFLAPRLEALNHPAVLGVTISTTEELVGVQLRATATENLGERLRKLMAEQTAVRVSGRLMRLDVRVPGTDTVIELDFERGKARSSAPVTISSFARIVARFMVNVPPSDRERLERTLGRDATP